MSRQDITFNLFYYAYHRSVGWVPCGGTYPPGFKSSTSHGCSHFPEFILGFNDAMLSVVDDVPVDSEAPLLTL